MSLFASSIRPNAKRFSPSVNTLVAWPIFTWPSSVSANSRSVRPPVGGNWPAFGLPASFSACLNSPVTGRESPSGTSTGVSSPPSSPPQPATKTRRIVATIEIRLAVDAISVM